MKKIFITIVALASMLGARGADPMQTRYSATDCQGSLRPYPTDIRQTPCPDSLEAVYINHVGRHGARYPASAANCLKLQRALAKADSLGTITATGRKLARINDYVIRQSADRWGALDSLGMAEQRGIATRMFYNFTELLSEGTVNAISSYSPRSMMSMYSFVHQLDRLNNHLEFVTATGRTYSPTMRPFDIDNDYLEFRRNETWKPAYEEYFRTACPTSAIERALGKNYPYGSDDAKRDLTITEYYVIAGLEAMSVQTDASVFFTPEEYNALWSCFNLRQYLQRTATTVSTVPADIASRLVQELIETTDNFIAGTNPAVANLRFGHAETVMPLVSLLRLPGCYYLTNYFDTVGMHWKDFDVVPMAANVQLILFRNRHNGRYYLRVDLNERPVPLIPNNEAIYVPWGTAREYMTRCLPLMAQ